MVYRLEFEASDVHELSYSVDHDGDTHSVTTLFAQCDESFRAVSIDVVLTYEYSCPYDGIEECQFYELTFGFSVTQEYESGPIDEYMNRDDTAQFIPDGCRGLVLEILFNSIKSLIDYVNPVCIYRVTYVPDQPAKAMRKHEAVTDLLTRLGYELLKTGTDLLGRRFWVMVRPQRYES